MLYKLKLLFSNIFCSKSKRTSFRFPACIALLGIVFAFIAPIQAEIIYLKNGTKLENYKLQKVTPIKVTFKSPKGKIVSYNKLKVAKIIWSENLNDKQLEVLKNSKLEENLKLELIPQKLLSKDFEKEEILISFSSERSASISLLPPAERKLYLKLEKEKKKLLEEEERIQKKEREKILKKLGPEEKREYLKEEAKENFAKSAEKNLETQSTEEWVYSMKKELAKKEKLEERAELEGLPPQEKKKYLKKKKERRIEEKKKLAQKQKERQKIASTLSLKERVLFFQNAKKEDFEELKEKVIDQLPSIQKKLYYKKEKEEEEEREIEVEKQNYAQTLIPLERKEFFEWELKTGFLSYLNPKKRIDILERHLEKKKKNIQLQRMKALGPKERKEFLVKKAQEAKAKKEEVQKKKKKRNKKLASLSVEERIEFLKENVLEDYEAKRETLLDELPSIQREAFLKEEEKARKREVKTKELLLSTFQIEKVTEYIKKEEDKKLLEIMNKEEQALYLKLKQEKIRAEKRKQQEKKRKEKEYIASLSLEVKKEFLREKKKEKKRKEREAILEKLPSNLKDKYEKKIIVKSYLEDLKPKEKEKSEEKIEKEIEESKKNKIFSGLGYEQRKTYFEEEQHYKYCNFRSFLFPGSGQFCAGENKEGWSYLLTSLGGLAWGIIFAKVGLDKEAKYEEDAKRLKRNTNTQGIISDKQRNDASGLRREAELAQISSIIGFATFITFYTWSIVDTWLRYPTVPVAQKKKEENSPYLLSNKKQKGKTDDEYNSSFSFSSLPVSDDVVTSLSLFLKSSF